MSYRKYLPSELLSDSIDYFYTMKINRHKIKTERLLPNGSFALILNYGSPIYTLDEDSFINSPDICVNKMHKKGFFVRQYPIIDIIGVAFKPGMIFNFTSVPISTFDIKYSTADTIFGNEINLLYKVIAKIKKEEDKIMLLEEFVLEKLSDKKPILNQLTLVVNKIIETDGILKMSDITNTSILNDRYIRRMFSQYLGMSPKYFSEIIRIRKAISLILNSNHTISESSYALEFHDLSHFNYTFKKITGTTPKRYFAEPNELSNFFLVSKSEIPHKSVDILKLLSQLKLSD